MDDEIWMKNHLVSDNNCNTINLYPPSQKLQGMTNNVGLIFGVGVGDTIPWFYNWY